MKNFQEAFELWFENAEDWDKERVLKNKPVAAMVLDANVEKDEQKYGSISEELAKMRVTFEKLANAYIKRQK